MNYETGKVEVIPLRQLLVQKFRSRQESIKSEGPDDPDEINESTCVQIQQNADAVE